MKNKILINQPGFLGDIIYVTAIAQKYVNEGYDVLFPVFDVYLNENIQKYFPEINFVNDNIQVNRNEYSILELRNSPSICTYQHMKCKYETIGLPYLYWKNIKIKRDYENEGRLYEKLKINGEKYNLINENHQANFVKKPIHVNNGYKNIYMEKIDDFTMFDWMGIIEKAETIHTIGTSLLFLIDVVETKTDDINIYKRIDKGHDTYDFLFTKKFKYH